MELPAHDARDVPEQREVPAVLQRSREEPRAAVQHLRAPHLRLHLDIAEQIERQRLRPRRGAEDHAAVHMRYPPAHRVRVRFELQPLLLAHWAIGRWQRHGDVRMGREAEQGDAGEQCRRQRVYRHLGSPFVAQPPAS